MTVENVKSTVKVMPLAAEAGSKANVCSLHTCKHVAAAYHFLQIGAAITGVDLNDLNEEDFQAIRNAIYVHRAVVVKAQNNLQPSKQLELLQRLDPGADNNHGFFSAPGDIKGSKAKFGVLGVCIHQSPSWIIL